MIEILLAGALHLAGDYQAPTPTATPTPTPSARVETHASVAPAVIVHHWHGHIGTPWLGSSVLLSQPAYYSSAVADSSFLSEDVVSGVVPAVVPDVVSEATPVVCPAGDLAVSVGGSVECVLPSAGIPAGGVLYGGPGWFGGHRWFRH
jgi:hypothetical protein